MPDGVAGVAQEAAVILRGAGEEGDCLTGHTLPSWARAAAVTRRRHRKLNKFLKKRKVKRISVSFDAAALSQVFANNEYFANYDELISLLHNYTTLKFLLKNKIQQTGKNRRQNNVKLETSRSLYLRLFSFVEEPMKC